MVFYIEACESGSMMNHLADNINGEQPVNLMDIDFSTCHRQDLNRYCIRDRFRCHVHPWKGLEKVTFSISVKFHLKNVQNPIKTIKAFCFLQMRSCKSSFQELHSCP